MKRNEILTILLDELLEEIKERKEINKLKRKQILSIMLDELVQKIEETIDFIYDEFSELERKDEDLKEYLDALSDALYYIENVN